MAKIFRLITAIVVSIVALFEVLLTGRAVVAWKMARLDSRALSQNGPGAGTADFTSISPRPGIIVFRTGRVNHSSPPDPALKISRLIGVGKYTAMLLFLAFVITAFVTCPNGQSFHQLEDGNTWTAQSASTDQGTEAPSSTLSQPGNILMAGCIGASMALAAVSIALNRPRW